MSAPLVDYVRYKKYYTSRPILIKDGRPGSKTYGKRINIGSRFKPPMGKFKEEFFTTAGKMVRQLLYQYSGRSEEYRGTAVRSVYFKWIIRLRVSKDDQEWIDSHRDSIYPWEREDARAKQREIDRVRADTDLAERLRKAGDEIMDMDYDVRTDEMEGGGGDGRTYLKLTISW